MSWFKKNNQLFIEEQKYIASSFPDLHYKIDNEMVYLIGSLSVETSINNQVVADSFILRFSFPEDYPETIPSVYELSHKIPKDFHTNPDTSFCLGTDLEIGLVFYHNKSIINFINHVLSPYLAGFIYYRDYGEMPFGERLHGLKGQLEFFNELFNTAEINVILKFLNAIERGKLRGHHSCPCESGKSFRKCHWNTAQKFLILPQKMIQKEIDSLQRLIH